MLLDETVTPSITERGGATAGRGGAFVVVAGCVVSVRLSSLFS